MLPLINLNNQSFEDIVDSVKKHIPVLNPEWTDTDAHDPGITMLEMFAWLKVLQQDYLSKIQPGSELKFLKLMGVSPMTNSPAEAYIAFSNSSHDLVLPKGTKLLADDMVFETCSGGIVVNNQVEALRSENALRVDAKPYDVLHDNRMFNIFGENPNEGDKFSICFKEPLAHAKIMTLYFTFYEGPGYIRNPIESKDDFIPLSELEWEYYGDEAGFIGWHPIKIIEDETQGFLFSGLFKFIIEGKHLTCDDGIYQIRCTLKRNGYELSPKLLKIALNAFKAVQKDTLCEYSIFSYEDMLNDTMLTDSYLAFCGHSKLFVRMYDSWVNSEDLNIKYHLEKDLAAGKCRLIIDGSLETILNKGELTESEIMIMLYDKSIEKDLVLGSGTGISNQYIDIKFKDLLYDSFEIMIGKEICGKRAFKKWNKVYSLDSSGSCSLDYIFDMDNSRISFGDHEKGQVPPKYANNIMVLSCASTNGFMGNIKKKSIREIFNMAKEWEAIGIRQITDAKGGRAFESIVEAKNRAKAKVISIGKAVTADDYEAIAEGTPGLLIKNVKALPLYEPNMIDYPKRKAENCITLVVETMDNNGKLLPEGYIKNIRRQIDKYRLITTKVHIVSPEYIGIDLFGEISIKPYYSNHINRINEILEDFFENHNRSYKDSLSIGDVYAILETLDCVSYIHNLYIEASGNYTEKTNNGDIRIPPNGRFYLKKNYLTVIELNSI